MLGSLVWISASLKHTRLLFIFSGFHLHHLCNACFYMQVLRRYVALNQSSFITDTCMFSGWESPLSVSLSRTRRKKWMSKQARNPHGCACPDTNLNKQTSCALVQCISLVYLDRVNKNADPTVTPCWPEPLLLLSCLINLSSKQNPLLLSHWMKDGLDERGRGTQALILPCLTFLSMHCFHTAVRQTNLNDVSVVSLHFTPTHSNIYSMSIIYVSQTAFIYWYFFFVSCFQF